MAIKCLALDAMGVIFSAADDVADLLQPFVAECGGNRDAAMVEHLYLRASLGEISADQLWQQLGIDSSLEDAYLARHRLQAGALELIASATKRAVPVWCLSNDLANWSTKLRQRLGIESKLAGAVISGDVGMRKPDPKIYRLLLERCGFAAAEVLFVDDRQRNVEAARDLGFDALRFDPVSGFDPVAKRLLESIA